MQSIISTSCNELTYDPELGIVMMRFMGDIPDEQYKAFWTKAIDFGAEKKINRVIIDQQNVGSVSFSARAWVVMNAFVRVKKEMPKSLAASILSSGRIAQKAGMQYLMKAFQGITSYKVEIHSSMEESELFLQKANQLEKVVG